MPQTTTEAGPNAEVIRVLLIDDEQEHFEITRALLSSAEHTSFDLDWVVSYKDAIATVATGEHDVYLVDYFLEDRTGLDLVREVQRLELSRPVIMLTGKGDRNVDLEAMRAGAADYLVKGRIDPQTLERSIRYALERQRAAVALREAEARSRKTFDHLPIGLFRLDGEGHLLEANPALHELLDYPDSDLLANGFARDLFVSPEDARMLRQTLDQLGIVLGLESHLTRADGTLLSVRVSAWVHSRSASGDVHVEGTVELVSQQVHPSAEVSTAEPRLP